MKINKNNLNTLVVVSLGIFVTLSTFAVVKLENLDIRDEAKKVQSMDNQCILVDITGESGAKDEKVNGYDLAVILGNWKWKKTPKIEAADIWGKDKQADGNVDMFDLGRVLYCWRLSRTDLAPRCGDGEVNGNDQCDPPGSSGQCQYGLCKSDCSCPDAPTTIPTTIPTTTSTTQVTTIPATTTVATTINPIGTCTCSGVMHGCAQTLLGEMCGWDDQGPATLTYPSLESACTVDECKSRLIQMADTECKVMNDPAQCSKVDDAKDVSATWTQ